MKKLLLFIFTFFCFCPAWADVSPKPEMEFSFIYETATKPAIDPLHSEQIQCEDNQCISAKPLGSYGLQKLRCTENTCFSIAYDYEPFQKLVIAFADGSKRESQVFAAPDTLRAHFNVKVGADTLDVTPAGLAENVGPWARRDAWTSLAVILILELLAAAAFLNYTQKSFTILYSVGLANLLTTAASWILLVRYVKETALLWIFCLLAETLIIRLMNRKKISLHDAFMLSLTTNVTSYSLGLMISFVIAPLLF